MLASLSCLLAAFVITSTIITCRFAHARKNDWPIEDCHSKDTDLVFVPDSTVPSYIYSREMRLLSLLLDVFSLPSDTNLTKLRVSLAVPSYNRSSSAHFVDVRITFDSYTNKTRLKSALEKENYWTPAPLNPQPMEAVYTAMQMMFNSSTYGPRRNAIRAMIVVFQGISLPETIAADIEKIECKTRALNVKLFFLIIGTEAVTKMQSSLPFNSHVIVENLEFINYMHHVPLRLCKKCFAGWFSVIGTIRSSSTKFSCYKLSLNNKDLNWIDANEKCKMEFSRLVSIETATEHSRLRNALPNEINLKLSAANLTGGLVSVYIGLKRRLSSIGQRFRWVSQIPLIHSQWRQSHPQGGNTVACAAWEFPTRSDIFSSLIRVSVNQSPRLIVYSSDSSDGWASVGCGNSISPFYLCEVQGNFRGGIPQTPKRDVRLSRPDSASIGSAIRRGELGFLSEASQSLMSVSILTLYKDAHPDATAFIDHDPRSSVQLDSLRMFSCDNFTQIPYPMVCDYVTNCTNEADEFNCGYSFQTCSTPTQFTCNNKQCVPAEAKCDLYNDCLDGSDEEDCITCPHGRCENARCLPKHWFGDGEIDCDSCMLEGNLEDEARSVEDVNINECVFICNRTECVYTSMLNDGIVQCQGPEGELDETIGAMESAVCYSDSENLTVAYTNWAPKCIYLKDRYGEPLGCRNMKHLENCDDFPCPEGYYKCNKSYCIPVHYLKNAEYDCPEGEDEDDLNLSCTGYFICAFSSICLHPDHVCDGQVNCPRGDDELNCNLSCREGFLCLAGTVTVRGYNRAIPFTDLDFVSNMTRYLDLSGVNVSAVFPAFPENRLKSVVNLSLSGCSITSLAIPQNYTPQDIRGIWWVDLSYNLIDEVPGKNVIRSMYALQFLNLSHNGRLRTVGDEAFNLFRFSSSLLRVLDLSYTALESIQSSMLSSLNNLEVLSLRNTRIVEIPHNMFPKSLILQILDLRGLTFNNLYPDMFKNVTIRTFLFTDSFKLCCPQIHNENTDVKVCISAKDPFSSCSDLMSEIMLRILLWVSGFLAIFGNMAVIIYRLSFDKMIFKMAYGHYIVHLSFADLFMGIYLIIIAAADTYYRDTYVWDEYDWRKSPACEIAGFLSTMSSETSTFFIFLITLDRFFAMRFPFRGIKISGHVITFTCVVTWALGFLIASIPLLPNFKHWDLYSRNGMCLALPLTNKRQPGWQFSTSIFIFLNFFLFILIAFGQLAIYKSVFAMRMSQSKLNNASFRRAQDLAVAKNLFLVVITDFMCWFPIGVMGLLALSGHEIGSEAYAWSAVLVLPVNSAINPLLYTVPAVTNKLKQYKDGMISQRSKS